MSDLWADHTWEELSKKEIRAVILPIGSTEQHSLHLPLSCDIDIAYKISRDIAERFGGKILVLPPIPYGVSDHHMAFFGTITITPETLVSLIIDIARSLKKHGIDRLIIVNGHGGNIPALEIVGKKIRAEGLKYLLINPWELVPEIKDIIESEIWGHACEMETSVSLYAIPEKVRKNRIKDPQLKSRGDKLDIWVSGHARWPWNTDDISDIGAIGYPTKATREKGEKIYGRMLDESIKAIKQFLEA